MKHYTQLTQEQRYQIYAYMKAGYNQTETADILDVHKSTVSRELRRNRGLRGYRPKQAHELFVHRQRQKARSRLTSATWLNVSTLLQEQWSPEQISLWLAQEMEQTISPEWIYQTIYKDKRQGGELYRHLRCQRKRRKRYGTYNTRGLIPDRVSIDERPAVVETRRRYGDWELDTIIGRNHQQAIVSLVERKSRLTLLAKVVNRTAEQVRIAIITLLQPIKDWVLTMTSDNGKEFAQHEHMSKQLKAKFYFAHPYASWERGLNENTNGLVRQYFPKKHDFTTVTDKEIATVMDKLNNRPRKCLGFKTPNQVFFGINPSVALVS